MKKLLSYVALAAISLGFSVSTFAADTLVAGADRGGFYYMSSGCAWTSYSVSTPIGINTTSTLKCSNVGVATFNYYNNNSAGAPIQSIHSNYYVTRRSGGSGANTYDYAVYKKAPVLSCSTPWRSDYIYNDLSSVSYARAMTMQFNPQSCSSANNCTLNIEANLTKYALVCK